MPALLSASASFSTLLVLAAAYSEYGSPREYGRADHAAVSQHGGGYRKGAATRVPQCAVLDPVASTTWESQGEAHFFYRFVVSPWRPFQLIQIDFHKPGPQFAIEHLDFVRVTGAGVYGKTPFSLTVELGPVPADPDGAFLIEGRARRLYSMFCRLYPHFPKTWRVSFAPAVRVGGRHAHRGDSSSSQRD